MVLEKVVADQIESYFEKHKLFGEYQFGFRRNKSTVSEMLTLYETLQEAKEKSLHSLVILFDLSAAFDTVEPDVLIRKLKIYGFDHNARSWMKSYLTGRSQVATVGGHYSKAVELNYGTPQGSRLSPLLFIILMADLDLWSKGGELSQFADDTQSSLMKGTEEELRKAAKEESAAVVSHFGANNLVNNADKAALLYNNKGKGDTITMEIAGETITSVSSEKLLGVHFSSEVNWRVHLDNTIQKLNQRLGILRRLKGKLPVSKLKIIADAIFTSVARYGIAVYSRPRLHSDPVTEDLQKLQKTQNKMFRLLEGKSKKDKVNVEKIAKKFGLMSINQMTSYHILMETYKILHFGASEQIKKKLVPVSTHSKSLKVPLVTKISCRGFTYYAAKLWNSLPPGIRVREKPHQEAEFDRKRISTFKKDIKNWIYTGGVPFK